MTSKTEVRVVISGDSYAGFIYSINFVTNDPHLYPISHREILSAGSMSELRKQLELAEAAMEKTPLRLREITELVEDYDHAEEKS